MVIAWTIFWSFVTMRSGAADGDSMDHFVVFLSPRGLTQQMVIPWPTFWSFLLSSVVADASGDIQNGNRRQNNQNFV